MTNPITPKAAFDKKLQSIPAFVVEVVNESIVRNMPYSQSGNVSFTIKKKEIIGAIYAAICDGRWDSDEAKSIESLSECEQIIYARKWLDFEPLYKAIGWGVTYDSPAFNETFFEPYFRFTAKVQ